MFAYSARGLTAYTNQIGATNFFAYDEAGRMNFETNANYQLLQFYYDPAGGLTNLVDGKGQSTRWNYDPYGRVTNKLDQLGTVVVKYFYDPDGRLTNRWSIAKANTRVDGTGSIVPLALYPPGFDILTFPAS